MDQEKDCSVLLISNKMSVVKKASHIIVIDRGMVKEEGNHEELMNNKGLYASLVEKQNNSRFRNEEELN